MVTVVKFTYLVFVSFWWQSAVQVLHGFVNIKRVNCCSTGEGAVSVAGHFNVRDICTLRRLNLKQLQFLSWAKNTSCFRLVSVVDLASI